MEKLTLYSTLGCHLCDDARNIIEEVLLHPIFNGIEITIETIDIAESDDLIARYGTRIPVVMMLDTAQHPIELSWPFDNDQFIAWWMSGLQ